jgi:hypothetical protein
MSCWVVPSVAAELWGCTLDAVLNAIRQGKVPSKEDVGMMFVDVAPESPTMEAPKAVLPPTPATYEVVSYAESQALKMPVQSNDEAEMHGDWRSVRRNVAASRRAPLAQAA